MVTLLIEKEEGAEEEVEEEEIGWVRDHMREISFEDLGEVLLKDFKGKWKRILFPRPFGTK